MVATVDVSVANGPDAKAAMLADSGYAQHLQQDDLAHPDARFYLVAVESSALALSEYASARTGLSAGDSEWFSRCFWEVPALGTTWEYMQTSVSQSLPYGGRSTVVLWEQEAGAMARLAASVRHLNHAAQNWRRGKPLWGRRGVAVSLMGSAPCTIYLGDRYDINCCAVVPTDERVLPALWAFCESCLLYTSPSPRDGLLSRMPSSA